METLILPGMHYEASRDGTVLRYDEEIKCVHGYRGFLRICAYDNTSLLCASEMDEKSIVELQRNLWNRQDVHAEDILSKVTPAMIKIMELPDIVLYSVGRLYRGPPDVEGIDHDESLKQDMETVDTMIDDLNKS